MRKLKPKVPLEAWEQERLARWLDARGVLWTATANGGRRAMKTAKALKAQGVKPGVPDILIFTPPPQRYKPGPNGPVLIRYNGVAIEMKRQNGTWSQVTPDQRWWLRRMEEEGSYSTWTKGADAAIKQLTEMGY